MPSVILSSLGDRLYINVHGILVFYNVWTSDLPNHNRHRRLPKLSEVETGLCWSPTFSNCTAGEHALFPFDFIEPA